MTMMAIWNSVCWWRQVPGHYPEPADSYLLKNQLMELGH